MIDLKYQLRIGNNVFYTASLDLTVAKVMGLHTSYADLSSGFNLHCATYNDPSQMQPILIDVQVIEACGFQPENISWTGAEYTEWRKNGFVYLLMNKNTPFWIHGSEIIGRNIKYLHQLQNLFLDVTGEQLEYHPVL